MRKFSAILLAVCLTAGSTTLFAKPKTNYKAFSPSDAGSPLPLPTASVITSLNKTVLNDRCALAQTAAVMPNIWQ